MTSCFHRIPIRIAILAFMCGLQAAAQPIFLDSGQPKDFSVSVGAHVTNLVGVTGSTGAVTYQWWFNDSPLAGATNRRLVLLHVQPPQAGNYFAVVDDSVGSVTSRVAKLEVDTTFTKITTGPIATNFNCVGEGSAVDYDQDGDFDLLLPGFGPGRSAFYRNDGDGTLTRLTDTNALPFLAPRDALPAAWGDYDNDGFPDLALMAEYNYSTLKCNGWFYRNNGDGTFSPGPAIEPNYAWTAAWGDYDHDGFLDLLIPQIGTRAALLLHNDGRGGFTKATTNEVGALADMLDNAGILAWADYSDDDWLDVLVHTYRDDMLFRNLGAGRFEWDPDSGVRDDAGSFAPVWGDFDNDGRLDLLFANMPPGGVGSLATLYRNTGGGRFEDLTATAVPQLEGTLANSVSAADYDNDGYLDAYLTYANELLHNNGDGTFTRIAAGSPVNDTLPSPSGSVSSQWFDFDNDGFLDLFVSCGSDYGAGGLVPSFLYRNNGNGNHWLKVRLVGTASNRMGAGAKVRIKITVAGKELWQRRDTTAGGIYNGNQPEAHFGLGLASKVDLLRVEWPSGNVQEWTDLPANQALQLTEIARSTPVRPVVTINGTVAVTSNVKGTSYQWYFGGAALGGHTSPTLTVSNAQPAHAGRYTVVAHADAGPRTNHVYLRVVEQFTQITSEGFLSQDQPNLTATWFDIDNDDYPDLYLSRWSAQAPFAPDALFRNNRDGTFTEIKDDPIAIRRPGIAYSFGGAAADYDNDGNQDLFVAHYDQGPSELFRNNGQGRFELVAGQPPAPPAGWWIADGGWADFDGDRHLDLMVVLRSNETSRVLIHRNQGDGTFSPFAGDPTGSVFDVRNSWALASWVDPDVDGMPDILVFQGNRGYLLYRNDGHGQFHQANLGSVVHTGDAQWAWGDYDNDGFPDLFTGSWSEGSRSRLYRNLQGQGFESVGIRAGITGTAHFSAAWADYDNDGYLDLSSASYTGDKIVHRNRGDGTFQPVDLGNMLKDGAPSLSYWADYDNNGFLDLLAVCGEQQPQPNHLYRNNGNVNHWLKVRLRGTASNRDGIGAAVRVRATIAGKSVQQLRQIFANTGVRDISSPLAHFGLGDATNATVRIEWPSGTVQELTKVAADQFLTVTEPAIIQLTFARDVEGIRIEWRGEPNSTYRIQASPNLKVWGTEQTVTTDAAGLAYAILPTGAGARFFRVVKE